MNRLRVLILSLLVLVTAAAALPVTETLAKWSRRSAAAQRKRYRKHSRAWWRRHRALMRARRARAEQRRRLAARAGGNAPQGARGVSAANTSLLTFGAANANAAAAANVNASLASTPARATVSRTAPLLPFGFATPHNWSPARKGRSGAAVFAVTAPDGRAAGTAVVAPVALSAAELAGAPVTGKTKTVGGMSVTALRRTVIDRMVAEGGWVTNDFVQDSHGRRVFVVLAQTGAPGSPSQSWAFYFTEVDGRVYSLATTAPVEFAAPLAAGSEQFMASLRPVGNTNAASQK